MLESGEPPQYVVNTREFPSGDHVGPLSLCSEVVEWASGGTFNYSDIGRMTEADTPKLRAATELMVSALADTPR